MKKILLIILGLFLISCDEDYQYQEPKFEVPSYIFYTIDKKYSIYYDKPWAEISDIKHKSDTTKEYYNIRRGTFNFYRYDWLLFGDSIQIYYGNPIDPDFKLYDYKFKYISKSLGDLEFYNIDYFKYD